MEPEIVSVRSMLDNASSIVRRRNHDSYSTFYTDTRTGIIARRDSGEYSQIALEPQRGFHFQTGRRVALPIEADTLPIDQWIAFQFETLQNVGFHILIRQARA